MSSIPESWEDILNSNGDPNLISDDLLMDMLKQAADESKSRVSIVSQSSTFATWELRNYRKLVTFIFDLVANLEIDDPYVRYNTCDLYEHFLQRFTDSVQNGSSKNDATNSSSLGSNVKGHSILRLISCIMLSTKVSSMLAIKNISSYISLIGKLGFQYNNIELTTSELIVMKTVDYKLDQCPLYTICPMLILILVYNDATIDGKLLYSILYKTMDYYYLTKADIFVKLQEEIAVTRKISYEEYRCFIADSMLIGCAIIAVTSTLVDYRSAPKVLKELVNITCYNGKDIELIRDVILEGILSKEEETSVD